MVPKNGQNGKVKTMRYKTRDDVVVYVGPWPSAQKTADAPVADIPASAPAVPVSTPPPVQLYGEPVERMARDYLTPLPAPPSPLAPEPITVPEPPPLTSPSHLSHLEQAVAGLGQAKDSLTEVHRGLSSVATIVTYTAVGLVAGVGIGTGAYYLMNPRSVASSVFAAVVVTFAGVVAGWYKAHHAPK